MIEEKLVQHCAPTLAGMKTANLFNLSFNSEDCLINAVNNLNRELGYKGISFLVLKKKEDKALIYVFRKSKLESDLHRKGVSELLSTYGYSDLSAEGAIEHLKMRVKYSDGFPPEIGLFLGYPLEDVKGFIINSGKNSKYTGFWKVYDDECEALKLFRKFKKCTDVYCEMFKKGTSVMRLTVAA